MPGAGFLDAVVVVIKALFIPVFGVNSGLSGIFSLAKFAPTDLGTAAWAGALCQVIVMDQNHKSARELREPRIFRYRK